MNRLKNIMVLPNGTHRVRIEHDGEKLSGVVATEDEAIELRDELRRKIVDGELLPTRGATAKALGPRFLSSRDGNRDKDNEGSRWHRHCATAPWARKALKSVTRTDGVAWLRSLKRKHTEPPPNTDPRKRGGRRAEKLGWQTRKHCINLARAFFNWAISEDVYGLSTNPFAELKVEREDGDEEGGYQEGWYLDAKQQTTFLGTWERTDLGFDQTDRDEKSIVKFAIGSGLREGEQWCLHLADVHVAADEPLPRVEVRFGSWDHERQRYRAPKGRKGEKKKRTVYLHGMALDAMRAWLMVLPSYCPKNPLGLAFPTERGARRTKAPRSWRTAVEAFGIIPRIGRHIWWHLLRHACASSMVSGWWGMRWSLKEVAAVLGHTSVKTTEIYAHLAPSAVQETAMRAHAAYIANGRNETASAQRPAARKEGNVLDFIGHARSDSNRRPPASKAGGSSGDPHTTDAVGRSVAGICETLELIASEVIAASMEEVECLERLLDRLPATLAASEWTAS